MPERKAASVFPEPVGAWTSTWPPFAIAGQPRDCAGVGASNVRSNHARVPSLNTDNPGTSQAYRPNVRSRRVVVASLSFVDYFSVVRIDGSWRIVNKAFAHTGGTLRS